MNATTSGCILVSMNMTAQRIAAAREKKGWNQSELARQLDVSPQSVQSWESGKNTPRPKRLTELASVLGVAASYLMGEEAPPSPKKIEANAVMLGPIDVWDDDTPLDDDEVYVPFLKEVELSAGSGRTAVQVSPKQKLRMGKLTLRHQGVQPSEAVCVTVRGNSMEPVLPDGCTVGVDKGKASVTDGKMYALDHDGQLRVKTLYRLPGGGIRMRSHNREEHPDEEYTTLEMADKDIHILGRIFWSSVLW